MRALTLALCTLPCTALLAMAPLQPAAVAGPSWQPTGPAASAFAAASPAASHWLPPVGSQNIEPPKPSSAVTADGDNQEKCSTGADSPVCSVVGSGTHSLCSSLAPGFCSTTGSGHGCSAAKGACSAAGDGSTCSSMAPEGSFCSAVGGGVCSSINGGNCSTQGGSHCSVAKGSGGTCTSFGGGAKCSSGGAGQTCSVFDPNGGPGSGPKDGKCSG